MPSRPFPIPLGVDTCPKVGSFVPLADVRGDPISKPPPASWQFAGEKFTCAHVDGSTLLNEAPSPGKLSMLPEMKPDFAPTALRYWGVSTHVVPVLTEPFRSVS